MSVAYIKKANFMPDNSASCEAAFVGHNLIFHRSMSSANIYACTVTLFFQKLKPSKVLYHSLHSTIMQLCQERANFFLLVSKAVA